MDIVTGADVIEYYAGLAVAIEGRQIPLRPTSFVYTRQEPLSEIPSHRALALLRGRREEVLTLTLKLPDEVAGAGVGRAGGARSSAARASSAGMIWQKRVRWMPWPWPSG